MSGYSGYSSYSSKVAGSGKKVCGLTPALFGGILTAAVLLIGGGVGTYVALGGTDNQVCATVPTVPGTTVTVNGTRPPAKGTRIDYECEEGYLQSGYPDTKQSVVCGEKIEGQIVVDGISCQLDCFELKIPSYLFEEHNAEKWCENKFDGVLLQNTLKYRSRRYHDQIRSMIGKESPGAWVGIRKKLGFAKEKEHYVFTHDEKQASLKDLGDESEFEPDEVAFRWSDQFTGSTDLYLMWDDGVKEHVMRDSFEFNQKQRAFCERLKPKCLKPKYRYELTGSRTSQEEAQKECVRRGGWLISEILGRDGQPWHKIAKDLGRGNKFWIGLSDRAENTRWRTASNGQVQSTFSPYMLWRWAHRQPSRIPGHDCIVVDMSNVVSTDNRLMDDVECGGSNKFIGMCEMYIGE